jgi:hypothetical protein
LFAVVNRGEFAINGFRNHEIRKLLSPATPISTKAARSQAAAIRRRILLLRVHGIVRKVGKTRRYLVTEKGRAILTAFLAAAQADVDQLTKLAA